MGVSAGFCMYDYEYDIVVKKFTFAISSPDEFLPTVPSCCEQSLYQI